MLVDFLQTFQSIHIHLDTDYRNMHRKLHGLILAAGVSACVYVAFCLTLGLTFIYISGLKG